MRSSSSSSAAGRLAKRRKTNHKTPVQRSPFTDFGSYMETKTRKLRSQFEAEASSSSLLNGESSTSGIGKGLFHGVSIFVDGHTVPSCQELKGYMLRHGGRLENYFSRSRVTHIICSNLPDSKMKNFRAFSRGLPVLKPAWVVDSVTANKLLSWPPYQLIEHSNDMCKQQKLSAFFGCQSISTAKDDEVVSDYSERTDFEGSEKTKDPLLPLETMVLDKEKLLNESIEVGHHKDKIFNTSLDKGTKIETSDASVAQLSIQSDSRDWENSRNLMHTKCQHSILTDPNFVEKYFKYSRLHFIGTWRNRYRKRFCNMLKGEHSKENVASCSSPNKSSIIHIDMDCFFVSVILRKHPELLDKPVAVCHSNNSRGTAEISSANYPARSYGIHAGMFVRDAKSCCPDLVIFPYDFGAYEEVADQFYSILHKHCNKVQALSCDEAFLDISEFSDLDPESFVSLIRKEIVETTQCTAAAGIAGNMLMARLATKYAKPNGQCFIPSEKVESFLDDLPIMSLPGIGRAIGDKLEFRQIHTCGQLRLVSKNVLHKDFGTKVGNMLWNYSRGIDDRRVEVLKETKSIGAEVNWGVRFRKAVDFENFLNDLSKEASFRLQECGVAARTINLKLKTTKKGANEPIKFMGCGDCENMSRSVTLPDATNNATSIERIANQIFASYHIDVKEVRGVGLQMSRLEAMDVNMKGRKHNALESWLAVPTKLGEESIRIDHQRGSAESLSASEEDWLDAQHNGKIHEYSHLCMDNAASDSTSINLCNSRSYENANPALPPVFLLDMSVIKDLPVELISEINDAYDGTLYAFMMKHVEEHNNTNLLSTPIEVIGGKALKFEATKVSCELNHSNKAEVSENPLHKVKQRTKSNILQIKSTTSADQIDFASGSSSKMFSIMQNFFDNANLDRPAPAHVPCHSASLAGDNLREVQNHIGFKESEKSKINLWSGNPSKWVDKFEVSNCLILNLIAQLYTEYGKDGLLSPILQSLISLYPLIFGSSSEEPLEAHFNLCELLLQYINLKIDSDIEELYQCCLLLERLASVSTVFLEVRNIFLPSLQVAVNENYGGTLQLKNGD